MHSVKLILFLFFLPEKNKKIVLEINFILNLEKKGEKVKS